MKYLIILLTLITIAAAQFGQNPFCSGFYAGYKEGYCYGKMYCLAPLAPLCPLPYLNQSSWKDGYNRGFILGITNQP